MAPSSFPLFSQLPTELHLMVWKELINEASGRVVEIKWNPKKKEFFAYPPGTLFLRFINTCYESREEALKYFQPLVVAANIRPALEADAQIPRPFGAWINPERDTLHLDYFEDESNTEGMNDFTSRCLGTPLAHKLKNISINGDAFYSSIVKRQDDFPKSQQWLKALKSMIELEKDQKALHHLF